MSKILSPGSQDRLQKIGPEEYLWETFLVKSSDTKAARYTSWLKHIVHLKQDQAQFLH